MGPTLPETLPDLPCLPSVEVLETEEEERSAGSEDKVGEQIDIDLLDLWMAALSLLFEGLSCPY